jgi:beta-galactosidase
MPIRFGAAYYPEYWPKERWPVDARLMREAGFNVVRIGEFAWKVFEPQEGRYDFALFDEAIHVLRDNGISVVLGTPTAAAPAWVEKKYPLTNRIDRHGVRSHWGSRQHSCYTNPKFRELSRNVVSAMARHYALFPGVIAWQTDNELDMSFCHCEHCLAGFREWLARRYGTPAALNAAWGLRFWGMDIDSFDEMLLPVEDYPSPSHVLDHYRFMNEEVLKFNREQAQIIKSFDPNVPVTHNFMPGWGRMDYQAMAGDLDFASEDVYPKDITTFAQTDYQHSLTRGYNGGAGFWEMELQCGYITRKTLFPTPPPGQVRLWTYQAIAGGADAIVYFRWRSCLSGVEQFHSGIVNHDGSHRTRAYKEIKEIGGEVALLEKLGVAGSKTANEAAILRGVELRWAADTYRRGSVYDYESEVQRWYRGFLGKSIGVDVIETSVDFSKYKLVVAPLLHAVDERLAARLTEYVRRGGTLITSWRAGVYNSNAVVTAETLPGKLKALFGVEIHDYDSLVEPTPADPKPVVRFGGSDYIAGAWADCLEPAAARALAHYANSWYRPYAAITENTVGAGRAIYVGTALADEFYTAFVSAQAKKSGIRPVLKTPGGVVGKLRVKDGRHFVFVMNYTTAPKTVILRHPMRDELTGKKIRARLRLAGRGIAVLTEV